MEVVNEGVDGLGQCLLVIKIGRFKYDIVSMAVFRLEPSESIDTGFGWDARGHKLVNCLIDVVNMC